MQIKTLFTKDLLREPMKRKFYDRIPASHVIDKGFTHQVFEADKGYFEIRVSEMFLRDKREYFRKFIPFAIVLSDFVYDGKRESFPFILGNQRLKSIEKYIKKESVEYRNERAVGPVPYMGDDVSLFVGLFRSEIKDLSKELFEFLENIVKAFDITKLSTYLEIARPLNAGLSNLLGMKEIEFRLGNEDVFTNNPKDDNRFQECYLAYINCPEDSISTDMLWVKNNRLFRGTKKNHKHLQEYDYCLTKIIHLPKRSLTTLPFHKLWEKAYVSVLDRNYVRADSLLLSLIHEVANSPDLITRHRNLLIQAYHANFEKAVEIQEKTAKRRYPTLSTIVTRGTIGSKDLSAKAVIKKKEVLAKKVGFSREVWKGLSEISTNWNRIPYLKDRPEDFKLNEKTLNEQFAELEAVTKIENTDPKALSDAITFATMSQS